MFWVLPTASRPPQRNLPKILLRRGRIFWLCPACVLQTPYKAPLTTGKKPGRTLLQPNPLKKPFAAESYYAAVGIFCLCPAHALQAIPHHRKEAGNRILCSQVSWKATIAPKSYCTTVGFFGLRSAPTLQSPPAKERSQLRKKSRAQNPIALR